jgi:antimicrobial peptide system SdpA family protein
MSSQSLSWTSRRCARLLAWWWTATAALALGALVSGLFASIVAAPPYNTLQPDSGLSSRIRRALPQGWSFFTKDPQEPRLIPYRVKSGTVVDAGAGGSFRASLWFGFDRAGRAQGPELAALVHAVGKDAWFEYAHGLATCAAEGAARPLYEGRRHDRNVARMTA